jgi:phage terminase large subunit
MRDFFNILDESPDNNPYFNKTEGVYTRWKGKIEFFGADDDSKVRGPRRDILFMNEGNNIPWETARGLDIRTSKFTIVDWNPVGEFWAHENWLNEPTTSYVHSTYLDARSVLPAQTVADIESYKDKDPNWWHIYGLGLIGKIEGLVYPWFNQVDELPPGNRIYGLDFGFSSDPCVLTANVLLGDKLYSKELLYKTGMTNDVIARNMDLLGIRTNYDEIYADSAEPKSIEEIHAKGFNIKPCEKGQGSVEYGIQRVNQYKQYWTKDSVNCIKEQRNFRYIPDKDGKLTEKTTHKWSHGMDSRRYAASSQITGTGRPKVRKAAYAF